MKSALRWLLTKLQGEQPDGFTAFGRTTWFVESPSLALQAHEAKHREQQRRDGWRYYVRYAWEFARHGYRGVSYEREAYEEQERVSRGGSG